MPETDIWIVDALTGIECGRFRPSYAEGDLFTLLWCHDPWRSTGNANLSNACGDTAPHCESTIFLEDNNHTILSLEPLSIVPSLVCIDCGAHGVVHEGRYVNCNRVFMYKRVSIEDEKPEKN